MVVSAFKLLITINNLPTETTNSRRYPSKVHQLGLHSLHLYERCLHEIFGSFLSHLRKPMENLQKAYRKSHLSLTSYKCSMNQKSKDMINVFNFYRFFSFINQESTVLSFHDKNDTPRVEPAPLT